MQTSQDQPCSTPSKSQLTTEPFASHGMLKMYHASRAEIILAWSGAQMTGATLPQTTLVGLVSTILFSSLMMKNGPESSSSLLKLAFQPQIQSQLPRVPQLSTHLSSLFQPLLLPPLFEIFR